MRGLERAKKLLRPFVDAKAWDYCVIWKLGDDPSRFIEWMGCCCYGAANGHNIKVERAEEDGEEQKMVSLCRDEHNQHPIRTKPCEALSQFPLFMNLYSGIHGEVVMSKLPRWLLNHQGIGFDSKLLNETMGTRVLVPVLDGLIELFSEKIVPPDQKMIELIESHCNVSLTANPSCFNAQLPLDPSPEKHMHGLSTSMLRAQQYLATSVTQSNSANLGLSFEGSSSGSNPSDDHPSPVTLNRPPGDTCGSKRRKCREPFLKHEHAGLVLDQGNEHIIARDNGNKASQKPEREKGYHSKNLVTERNRRNRIKHGLYALRAIVPKITKMDKSAILGDAVDYIGELQREKMKLEEELKEIDEIEKQANAAEEKSLKPFGIHQTSTPASDQSQVCTEKSGKTEENVEVNQIGADNFLIRVCCEYKRGGFEKLMEAVESLELEIVDANVTTFSDKVSNVLNAKANKEGIQARYLRDLLFVMIGSKSHSSDERFDGKRGH